MPNNDFNIVKDKDHNVFCISPVPLSENGKWLIICENEEDAKKLVSDFRSSQYPTPLQDPSKYRKVTTHPNGYTPIVIPAG